MEEKKLRILQMMDSYYPHVDGVVNVVDSYATHLNALGDKCTVCVPRCGKYTDAFPYPVYRCPSVATGKSFYLPAPDLGSSMGRRIGAEGADIIHAHTPFMMGHYALKMAKKFGVPMVTTFHSKYKDDFLAYTHSESFARFGLKYMVKFYSAADEVWTVSDGAAETLHEYGFKGEIMVMHTPPDSEMLYPDNPQELMDNTYKTFGELCPGIKLLFVGQTIWQKNFRLILDSLAILEKQGVEFSLTVAGNGDNASEITAYAAEKGIAHRVYFLGRVSDRKLLQGLYLRSDLFFFPSVYDTAGMVVQEASMCKTPSLLMRATCAAEGVTDGENGYLCKDSPESAAEIIAYLARHKEDLQRTGINASRTLARDPHEIMQQVRQHYLRIIERKRQKQ